MLLQVVGRYEIFIAPTDSYVVYRQSGDRAAESRVVSVSDIDAVVARKRATAPVRLYKSGEMGGCKNVIDAAKTGEIVSEWSITGVELDSLFGAGEEGLYLVGDETVCIATYDLNVARDKDRGFDAECGIDGLLLKPPFAAHCACACGRFHA